LQGIKNLYLKPCKFFQKMKPKKTDHSQGRLFEQRLSELLNPQHEFYMLAEMIDWDYYEKEFGQFYSENASREPKPIRLMVGLIMLQNMFNLSDKAVVRNWLENPYWQFFCGFDFLQWKFPIDPSTLTRFRTRLGEKGAQKIFKSTVQMAIDEGFISPKSLEKVTVDTTVMEKNITHPTDAKLYHRAREKLVKWCEKEQITLRQKYTHVSKKTLHEVAKYAHARQMNRAKQKTKRLKVYLGRVYRDAHRKARQLGMNLNKLSLFNLVDSILYQDRTSSNKIYSFHEPHVCCIAKGKAHKKYEFGCKVSVTVTHKEGLALDVSALEGNPYDGHTLKEALMRAEKNSQSTIKVVFTDKGYRGHHVTDKLVFRSGQKRGVTAAIKKQIHRRQAIEPHIGHMKEEGKLRRNFLKGFLGDKLNAIFCGLGHNLRFFFRKLATIPGFS
jgi:IS5 family transposase